VFKRDSSTPIGTVGTRQGAVLGESHRLGLPDVVIQRILRHANLSTTATYYIKTAADDVRNAMAKLEQNVSLTTLQDTIGTLNHHCRIDPASVNWCVIMGLRRIGPVAQMDRAAVS
jgi:hypothetical protein